MIQGEFVANSVKATKQIAGNLARELKKNKESKTAVVIGLEGELGAGKTVFVKGFARALGIKEKILSPTFVLMKSYKLRKSAIRPTLDPRLIAREFSGGYMADFPRSYKFLIHIDTYRLKNHQDLIPLGIKEILENPENVVLIEWSDRVQKILPKKYIKVHIDHISENERKIVII